MAIGWGSMNRALDREIKHLGRGLEAKPPGQEDFGSYRNVCGSLIVAGVIRAYDHNIICPCRACFPQNQFTCTFPYY